jgi:hypothetical protein
MRLSRCFQYLCVKAFSSPVLLKWSLMRFMVWIPVGPLYIIVDFLMFFFSPSVLLPLPFLLLLFFPLIPVKSKYWFLVLGILHGVRGEFTDDVSGAVVGPIFTVMTQNVNEQHPLHPCTRQHPTPLLIYALTHDQWRWDRQRLPKRRR